MRAGNLEDIGRECQRSQALVGPTRVHEVERQRLEGRCIGASTSAPSAPSAPSAAPAVAAGKRRAAAEETEGKQQHECETR